MAAPSLAQKARLYQKALGTCAVESKAVFYTAYRTCIMSCSPLAIFQELLADPEYAEYEHFWAYASDEALEHDTFKRYRDRDNVHFVKAGSEEYARAIATCRYLVTNASMPSYWRKREGQVLVSTWHGTPLKTLGIDVRAFKPSTVGNAQRVFLLSDYLVMPNRYTTQRILNSYAIGSLYRGKILDVGSPRVDMVLNSDKKRTLALLEERYGASLAGKKIALYAPTFRSEGGNRIDTAPVMAGHMAELVDRMPDDFVVFFKVHNLLGRYFADVDSMQRRMIFDEIETNELLGVTDVLITDYSSIFFDFICTRKPILFFTYDKHEYESNHGLYRSISDMPGTECDSIDEVIACMERIGEGSYSNPNQERALGEFAYNDDGHAAKRAVDIVFRNATTHEGALIDCAAAPGRRASESVLVSLTNNPPLSARFALQRLLRTLNPSRRNVVVSACNAPLVWEMCASMFPDAHIVYFDIEKFGGLAATKDDGRYRELFNAIFPNMEFDAYYNVKPATGFIDEVVTHALGDIAKHWRLCWSKDLDASGVALDSAGYDSTLLYLPHTMELPAEIREAPIKVVTDLDMRSEDEHAIAALLLSGNDYADSALELCAEGLAEHGADVLVAASRKASRGQTDASQDRACSTVPLRAIDEASFAFIDMVLAAPTRTGAQARIYRLVDECNTLTFSLYDPALPTDLNVASDILLALDEAAGEELANIGLRVSCVAFGDGRCDRIPAPRRIAAFLELAYETLVASNLRITCPFSTTERGYYEGFADFALEDADSATYRAQKRYRQAVNAMVLEQASRNRSVGMQLTPPELEEVYSANVPPLQGDALHSLVCDASARLSIAFTNAKDAYFASDEGRLRLRADRKLAEHYLCRLKQAGRRDEFTDFLGSDAFSPEISVIMPIYNTQEYLSETLESLELQQFCSFEVIMVNDGSTDDSGAIAQAKADSDPRFRYFEVENAGPGAARNFAMRFARGNYIAFCDSDDKIPELAYKHMHDLALKHDCDIVIGSACRFNSEKQIPSRLHRKALAGLDELVHITKHPQLIYDTTAWNSLYSREYLDRMGFEFPEGMIFEDMPIMIEMQYRAKTCAFLDEVVYMWRMRDGETKSLTQDKTAPGVLEDRLHAMRITDEFFERNVAERRLIEAKNQKWLNNDLVLYMNALPEIEDRNRRDQMRQAMLDYIDTVDAAAFESIPAINRIKYQLLREGNYEMLSKAVAFSHSPHSTVDPHLDNDGNYYGSFGFGSIAHTLESISYELAHLSLQTTVERIAFSKNGLHIDATMFFRGIQIGADDCFTASLSLRNELGDILPISAPVVGHMQPSSSISSNGKAERYEYHFETALPSETLSSLSPGTYRIALSATYNNLVLDATLLKNPVPGRQTRPFPHRADNRIVSISYNSCREIKVCVNEDHSPTLKDIEERNGILIGTDAYGLCHEIAGDEIDVKHRRIGDPADREFFFFGKAPLLCSYESGFLQVTRTPSGLPHVSYIEQGAMINDATCSDGMLSMNVQLSRNLQDATVPKFVLRSTAPNDDDGEPPELNLRIRVKPFEWSYLVEIDFKQRIFRHPKPGEYVLSLLDKDGNALPVLRNATRCCRIDCEVEHKAQSYHIEIGTAFGCTITHVRQSS